MQIRAIATGERAHARRHANPRSHVVTPASATEHILAESYPESTIAGGLHVPPMSISLLKPR
jgi:hypothetical protein